MKNQFSEKELNWIDDLASRVKFEYPETEQFEELLEKADHIQDKVKRIQSYEGHQMQKVMDALKDLDQYDREDEGLCLGEITKFTGIDRQTVHYIIEDMKEKEEIEVVKEVGKTEFYRRPED